MGVNLLCLVGRGGLAGADGPHGLVGDDHFFHLLGGEMEETFFDLTLHHVELTAGFALLKHLADTYDGFKAMGQQAVDFGGHGLVGLAIVGATLRVTHNAVVNLHAFKHLGTHLASVGTLLLGSHVLCANHEIGVVGIVGGHLKIGERRADDELCVARKLLLLKFFHDSIDEVVGLGEGAVHLPVACYDMFSHCYWVLIVND